MTDFEYIEFDVEQAKRVLDGGSHLRLYYMCTWRRTPQGYDFWDKEADRLFLYGSLSEEARSIIEGWIREYEGNDHNHNDHNDHAGMIYNEYNKTWSFF